MLKHVRLCNVTVLRYLFRQINQVPPTCKISMLSLIVRYNRAPDIQVPVLSLILVVTKRQESGETAAGRAEEHPG